MKIANLHELQNIFAKVNLGEIPGEDPVFILINSTSLLFGDELMKQLALISKEQQLLAIALIVEHTDAPRIDSLIIVCRKAEINSFFCNKLMAYVNDTTSNIISYLRNEWTSNNAKYPIVFTWTTRLDGNYTLIANRAVAPAYQGNGLMKSLSLALIQRLNDTYGFDHELKSFTVHPATYLFLILMIKSS